MRLTVKFSLFIVVLVFTLVSIITAVFVVARIRQIQQDLVEKDRVTSVIAAQELSTSFGDYYFYQYDTYREFVRKKLHQYGDILHFTMYGTNGDILFDTIQLQNPPGERPPEISQTSDSTILTLIDQKAQFDSVAVWNTQSVIRVIQPYIDRDNVYHNLFEFHFSTSKIDEAIRQTILYYSLSLIIFITISVGITIILVRQIVRPITTLTQAVADFPNGANHFPTITSKDEIGTLAKAFLTLTQDLSASQAKLASQNQTLEQEVEKRTGELKQQIIEMERLQRITVDRELKMIEMKKELDSLTASK